MTSTKDEKIQALEQTLCELDEEIKRLLSRKTKCLRQLNDLKAYTAILPVELLSSIFENACSDTTLPPLTLGAVSSHWRNVTWSCPRLWTSIRITIMPEAARIPEQTYHLLRLYFTNAQALPLSLQLVGIKGPATIRREPTVPRKQLLDLILNENQDRLGALAFTFIQSTWWDDMHQSASPICLLPTLKTLELGWSLTVPGPRRMQFICPNLTSASLSGHVTPVELPWRQLTRLKLYGLPIDRCLSLLFECPLLEEYHCDLARWIHPTQSEFVSILAREDVTLPNLRKFGWWFLNDDWTDFLMDVQFPSLLHLSSLANVSDFHRSSIYPLPHHFIKNCTRLKSFMGDIRFIWRGPSLDGYTIDIEDENIDEGVSGLLSGEDLEELAVHNLDVHDFRFIFDQLTVVHHPAYWDNLSRLRNLSVRGANLPRDIFNLDVFLSFVRFLGSRRSGFKLERLPKPYSRIECIRLAPIDSFQLPVGSSEDMIAQFRELREIVRSGLRIELQDSSGKTVVWS
ncbi:hypothetical protein AN958_02913 [Leucoagaricus sp. SymC.cos]|nr:hypothetical protein AN958_02913 [Leucoagaricus sp. SymC.cos]